MKAQTLHRQLFDKCLIQADRRLSFFLLSRERRFPPPLRHVQRPLFTAAACATAAAFRPPLAPP